MRIKLLLLVFICVLLISGCSFQVTQGSGNIISENREISSFDRIYLSGIGEMLISQGDTESLQIEAEDNVLSRIKVKVEGDTLYLGMNTTWENNIVPTKPIKYYITVKNINQVNLSGAGSISAGSINADRLTIVSSGAGSIKIRDLTADSVLVNISGIGNCDLNGKVNEQRVDISGTGTYNAEDLDSKSANITMSGAGNATVWAADTLDVIISGAGNVSYYDNPRITKSISGVGNLKNLGEH